jgi:hypothetical protein
MQEAYTKVFSKKTAYEVELDNIFEARKVIKLVIRN